MASGIFDISTVPVYLVWQLKNGTQVYQPISDFATDEGVTDGDDDAPVVGWARDRGAPVNTTPMYLVYNCRNGYQPWQNVVESGTLVDPDTDEDAELIGWTE